MIYAEELFCHWDAGYHENMLAETLSRWMTGDSFRSHGDILEDTREAYEKHVNINTIPF